MTQNLAQGELSLVGRSSRAANDTESGPQLGLTDLARFALDTLFGEAQVGGVSQTTETDMNSLVSGYTDEELVAFMRKPQSEKNIKPSFFRAVRGEARRRGIIFP